MNVKIVRGGEVSTWNDYNGVVPCVGDELNVDYHLCEVVSRELHPNGDVTLYVVSLTEKMINDLERIRQNLLRI